MALSRHSTPLSHAIVTRITLSDACGLHRRVYAHSAPWAYIYRPFLGLTARSAQPRQAAAFRWLVILMPRARRGGGGTGTGFAADAARRDTQQSL